jgi:dihydroorotate dehydrogenase
VSIGIYRGLARPVLFRLGGGDAEAAHEATVHALARLGGRPAVLAALRRWYSIAVPRRVFGLDFPNVVGLAAGLDKDGEALPAWTALGFGFVEVGTVTWHPQPGNPRPRLFRLRGSEALINRMGFNNRGAGALAARLATRPPSTARLGISLGKSKVTPLADAVADYVNSARVLRGAADYFAVNVSSPNTPGLRTLQDREHLDALLAALRAEVGTVPLLVKIAPDLTEQAIAEVLEVCQARRIDGVIATNTTVARDGLDPSDQWLAGEQGGLSGAPLAARAREVVAFVHKETGGRLPVIGVGGILRPDDAARLLEAGASLVQVCTGLIYQGPGLVRAINRRLARAS